MPESTCRWPECDNPVRYVKHGLCGRDYQRARNAGDFVSPWLTWRAYNVPAVAPECRWEGCEAASECAGFCNMHYRRSKVVGNDVDPWVDWDTSGKCAVCGKAWSGGRNRNKRVCSKSCRVKEWRLDNPEQARANRMDAVRRRRARIAGVTVENFTIKDVRMARGDDCYLCGKRINYKLRFPHPESPSLDHVIPISAGGAHSLENVAMAHMGCNNSKNSRPTDKTPIDTLFST